MQSQEHCPFCEPNTNNSTFMESNLFRALYNKAPILPGHSLVVPKRHITSIMDLNDVEACEIIGFSRDVVKMLMKAFQASGFDWTIQEGIDAGQTVEHLHLHLIPRKHNDLTSPGDWYPMLVESEKSGIIDSESRSQLTPDEMESIVNHLKNLGI